MTTLDVVVGAQFGSEAKGHVTQRLIDSSVARTEWAKDAASGHAPIYNVRVAGPNAGHTGHSLYGVKIAFRQLPIGALRPGVTCVIAPGSEVQASVLMNEIDAAIRYGYFDPARLWIDSEATLLEPSHIDAEQGMNERLGSTGKGIGAARAERLMRRARRVGDDEAFTKWLLKLGAHIGDTANLLTIDDNASHIIIEGTQGYGLGLHAGSYPYCTSSDCRAIDFLGMAGLSPWWFSNVDLRVWAVARTFPIRVAGNSGPLYQETSWEKLGLPPEYTTVTKKMRRVGHWDMGLVQEAVLANGGGPTVRLAITMLDQRYPELAGVDKWGKIVDNPAVEEWIEEIEENTGADVELVTTGPNTGAFI